MIAESGTVKRARDLAIENGQLVRYARGRYGAPDWGVDPSSISAACATVNAHVNDF